jgi:uncharacterized membrane protein
LAEAWTGLRAFHKAACRPRPAPVKPRRRYSRSPQPMIAIGAVVLFLVVIAALNFYEFGRLD